jgi:hypothetical protein
MSLQSLTSETIRQNWDIYKNIVINTPFYENIWDEFEIKQELNEKVPFYLLLKYFINNTMNEYENKNNINYEIPNENIMVINKLDGDKRKFLHLLCDKIGLHHDSKTIKIKKGKHCKQFYIYKPEVWLWEYTEKNPYSKDIEYYNKKELERQQQKLIKEENLRRKYCCICEKNGLETDLFCSVYIRGLFCDECLETMSDGDGNPLNCHKFEPI